MELFGIPSRDVYTPKLVQDTYSNKFYGESSYSEYASAVQGAIKHYSNIVEQAKKPSVSGFFRNNLNQEESTSLATMFGKRISSAENAKNKLASIRDSSSGVTENNYIQQHQINASYAADKVGWDKYFEGNYKNPRMKESDQSASQFQTQGNAPSALAIKGSNTSRSPKTIGTGTGLTSVGLNPFGRLDAGLGI